MRTCIPVGVRTTPVSVRTCIAVGTHHPGFSTHLHSVGTHQRSVRCAYVIEAPARVDVLASHAARRALALVADLEGEAPDAAEGGLIARHILRRTVGRRLPPFETASTAFDDVHEATDLADEGLDLVRRWEEKGLTKFRAIALDLFRFGAAVYTSYQPQFLVEFVLENLDPARSSVDYVEDRAMQSAAAEALGAQTSSVTR